MASSTRSVSTSISLPGTSFITKRPSSPVVQSTRTACSFLNLAVAAGKGLGKDIVVPNPALFVCCRTKSAES